MHADYKQLIPPDLIAPPASVLAEPLLMAEKRGLHFETCKNSILYQGLSKTQQNSQSCRVIFNVIKGGNVYWIPLNNQVIYLEFITPCLVEMDHGYVKKNFKIKLKITSNLNIDLANLLELPIVSIVAECSQTQTWNHAYVTNACTLLSYVCWKWCSFPSVQH